MLHHSTLLSDKLLFTVLEWSPNTVELHSLEWANNVSKVSRRLSSTLWMLPLRRRKANLLNITTQKTTQSQPSARSWSINPTALVIKPSNWSTSGSWTCHSPMIWRKLRFKTNSSRSLLWKLLKPSSGRTTKGSSKWWLFWEKSAGRSNLTKRP